MTMEAAGTGRSLFVLPKEATMVTTARVRTEPVRVITVRLTEQERASLHAYAVKNDLRLAQVIRRWIREVTETPRQTASDDAA